MVALLFSLSFLFSKVKITINPKTAEVSLNGDFSASKDAKTSSLSFDLVVISGEQEKTIQGGEMKEVKLASTGRVILYNNFSTSSQNLDIDTRLSGSNGKIYKITTKTTIPGITSDGKPGSVEVGIYAAEPGESYDSGPLDFNIVGFKGTPKYSKFYARSKGAISGGYIGEAPVVSDLEKASASSEIRALLESKLLKKVIDQIPTGFVLYEDAILLDIGDKNIVFTPSENNTVMATLKGTLYGFIFNKEKLTKKIAEDALLEYAGEDIYIPNIKNLEFTFLNKESVSFTNIKNINFNITGTPYFVYKVDEDKLNSDVLNKEKKELRRRCFSLYSCFCTYKK